MTISLLSCRRAKIKNIARKSIENGEDCESIPESMRRHLAMQAMESGTGSYYPGLNAPNATGYNYGSAASLNTDQANVKVGGYSFSDNLIPALTDNDTVIQHFACRSLSIGSWRRVGQSQMDLIIFYSPEKACVTYYINNDSAGYKIEYPFAWIKNINLVQGDLAAAPDAAGERMGSLVVELIRPPKFYMDSAGTGGFYECGDFTEDQQASSVMMHHLSGPSKALSGQLAKLVSLESFQNRHNLHDPGFAPISAPVTPIGFRPASQPNHLVHPHSAAFHHDSGLGLMGPPAPRGHKRQRSRSVPAAIDFSSFRSQPMPSFMIQHGQAPASLQPLPESLFAPIPQHHNNPGFVPGPAGPNLSIDTSAGYGMDIRHFAGPMSANTPNSPGDFGTPGLFNSVPNHDMMNMQTPYASSFLSVDQAAMIGTSNTPVSVLSHGDPVIADQSPPLTGLGHNQNDDIFSTPGEHQLNEDTLCLSSDMYSKTYGMPYHSPGLPNENYDYTSPAPANMKMQLPFRPQDQHLQTPIYHHSSPHPGSQQSMHHDSGIAFHSPTQMPPGGDNGRNLYQTPKTAGSMMYHDSKMYQTPGPMHDSSQYTSPHDSSMYHSPSLQAGVNHEVEQIDLNSFVNYGGTIDPSSL